MERDFVRSHVHRAWYPTTYSRVIPTICEEIQKIAMERRRVRQRGEDTINHPLLWEVHVAMPRYVLMPQVFPKAPTNSMIQFQ